MLPRTCRSVFQNPPLYRLLIFADNAHDPVAYTTRRLASVVIAIGLLAGGVPSLHSATPKRARSSKTTTAHAPTAKDLKDMVDKLDATPSPSQTPLISIIKKNGFRP